MAEPVTLANLEAKLSVQGSTGSTGFAAFILAVSVYDGVGRLYGRGLGFSFVLEKVLTAGQGFIVAIGLLIALQMVALVVVAKVVSQSGLKSMVGSDLTSITSFGAGTTGAAKIKRRIHQIVFGVALAALLNVALTRSHGMRVASGIDWVDLGLSVSFSLAAAWVVSVLLARTRPDYPTLVGGASGLVICFVLSTIGLHNPMQDARIADAIGANTWLLQADLLFLNAAVLIAAMTMVFGSSKIFNLSTNDADRAPPLIIHDPFSVNVPTPNFVTFQGGSGHILALARGLKAPHYETVNVTDSHIRLPVYDRSLLIWNFTRMARSLPATIEATDSVGYFKLTASLGSLAIPASVQAGILFELSAVQVASQALFSTTDLKGLLSRAATAALEPQVADARAVIDRVHDALRDTPSKLQAEAAIPYNANEHALHSEHARMNLFIERASNHIEAIKECVRDLRGVAQHGRVIQKDMHERWLEAIIADVTRATVDHGMQGSRPIDIGEAKKVLNVVGLRLNNATIVLHGEAATCETLLTSARRVLEDDVSVARIRRDKLHDELEEHRRTVAVSALKDRPLSREQTDVLLGHTLGAGGKPQVLPPPDDPPKAIDLADDAAPN